MYTYNISTIFCDITDQELNPDDIIIQKTVKTKWRRRNENRR